MNLIFIRDYYFIHLLLQGSSASYASFTTVPRRQYSDVEELRYWDDTYFHNTRRLFMTAVLLYRRSPLGCAATGARSQRRRY